MKTKYHKIFSGIFIAMIVSICFSPFFAKRAEALFGIGDITFDPTNLAQNTISAGADYALMIKEYGLDAVAWIVVDNILERLAASTLEWINSGFEGSPAYLSDSKSFFMDIGDNIAGQYIFTNPNLSFLCGPISAKIKIALVNSYVDEKQWKCSLSDVGANMESFLGNFDEGGWDAFFEMTQNPHNNPLGAFLQAESELKAKISEKKDEATKELSWGSGFRTYKKCSVEAMTLEQACENTCAGALDNCMDICMKNKYTKDQLCEMGGGVLETYTPGKVIEDQLNNVLQVGNRKLEAADEIDEIVSSLLNQMVKSVVGGVTSGLRGLSDSGSGGEPGGKSLVEMLAESQQETTVDYFGEGQNEEIPDAPIPQNQSIQDKDCNLLTSEQIGDLLEQASIANPGATLDQLLFNLDCPPAGINF